MSRTTPASEVNHGAAESARHVSFIAELTEDMERGSMDLLGYPEVAIRIQRALAQEHVGTQQLVQLIGSEPVLASRILCMANSVALNPRGEPVTELRSAVSRLGTDLLRGAVMSHAMGQVRASRELAVVAIPMRDLWQCSVVVAALCGALARRHTRINPDAAQLAGLLHGVGKLYILIKASRHPEMLADERSLAAVTGDLHAVIGRALLEQWEMPATITEAVGNYESVDWERDATELDLTDVLCCAALLAAHLQDPEQLELVLATFPALARFGLTAAVCQSLIGESERQIGEVLEALGM